MANNIIQVCEDDKCTKSPTEPLKVGKMTHVFCCDKGFKKSLSDFTKYIGTKKTKSTT